MKPDWEEMPIIEGPNPLPCGCGIKGITGINYQGTRTIHRKMKIEFCPLHRAAPIGEELAKTIMEEQETINARDFDPRGTPNRKEWAAIVAKAREFKAKTEER